MDDAAKSVVITDIVKKKRVETAKWWLRVKMPEEFAPRNEINIKIDWDNLTDEQLNRIADGENPKNVIANSG